MMMTLMKCKICQLSLPPENMQAIFEHHCVICRDCVGIILRSHVGIPNYEIERRKKNNDLL